MTRDEAARFALSWIDAWNRRDIECVLAMYADELSFTSPTALEVVGRSTIAGKSALRDYWLKALAQLDDLQFAMHRIIWDEDTRELGIIYTRRVRGSHKRVVETFRFDEADRVVATEVLHGQVPS
jgi:ketosteroid isomerase-like protein